MIDSAQLTLTRFRLGKAIYLHISRLSCNTASLCCLKVVLLLPCFHSLFCVAFSVLVSYSCSFFPPSSSPSQLNCPHSSCPFFPICFLDVKLLAACTSINIDPSNQFLLLLCFTNPLHHDLFNFSLSSFFRPSFAHFTHFQVLFVSTIIEIILVDEKDKW